MKSTKAAERKESEEVAEGSRQAVYVCSLVLARHILALHPEYDECIKTIGVNLKDIVK